MREHIYSYYIKKPVFLLALSLILGTLTNFDFVKATLRGEKKFTIEDKVEDISSDFERISIDEAAEIFIKDKAVFIDARDQDSYEFGHIPGAINVPWEEAQYDDSIIAKLVPPGFPLITYCDGSDCESSILLAGAMAKLGLDDVRVFFGGWVEWEEAEYPIEEGKIIIRLVLGGILLYASIGKVTHAEEFATAMANYRMLPSSLIFLSSLIIPWLELILGILLVTGIYPSTSAFMTAVLFLVFTVATAQAIVRGIDISCGCFDLSGSGGKIDSITLVRNLLLFSGAIIIMRGPRGSVVPQTRDQQ
jgi:rhodanese-related sulfurtransferase